MKSFEFAFEINWPLVVLPLEVPAVSGSLYCLYEWTQSPEKRLKVEERKTCFSPLLSCLQPDSIFCQHTMQILPKNLLLFWRGISWIHHSKGHSIKYISIFVCYFWQPPPACQHFFIPICHQIFLNLWPFHPKKCWRTLWTLSVL